MSKGLIYRLRQGQESLKPACIQANMLIHLPVSPPPHPPTNSPFPHDVAIERVEDTLVGQLQGVVEHHQAIGSLGLRRIVLLLRLRQLLLPHLGQPFELVAAIAESAHSVHIERVFSLTDGGRPLFHASGVHLLVGLAAVFCNSTHKYFYIPCEWSATVHTSTSIFHASGVQRYTQVLLYSMRVECNGTHKYFYIPCEWSATVHTSISIFQASGMQRYTRVLLYSKRVECNGTHEYFYIPCGWSATVHTSTSIFHAGGVQRYTRVFLYSMRVECNGTHEYFYIPCEWSATVHKYFYIPCEWSATVHTSTSIFHASGVQRYTRVLLYSMRVECNGTHKYFYIPCEWSATVHTSISIFHASGVQRYTQVFLYSM